MKNSEIMSRIVSLLEPVMEVAFKEGFRAGNDSPRLSERHLEIQEQTAWIESESLKQIERRLNNEQY